MYERSKLDEKRQEQGMTNDSADCMFVSCITSCIVVLQLRYVWGNHKCIHISIYSKCIRVQYSEEKH
jgi:hypothetical protein